MLAGCLPFEEPDLATLFRRISRAQYDMPPWFSAEQRALLGKMLVIDPEERYADLATHVYQSVCSCSRYSPLSFSLLPLCNVHNHRAGFAELRADPWVQAANHRWKSLPRTHSSDSIASDDILRQTVQPQDVSQEEQLVRDWYHGFIHLQGT